MPNTNELIEAMPNIAASITEATTRLLSHGNLPEHEVVPHHRKSEEEESR